MIGFHNKQSQATATSSVSRRAMKVGLVSQRCGGCQGPPRVLGRKEIDSKHAYASKWTAALCREAQNAAAASAAKISLRDVASLKRDGLVLLDLRARTGGWLFSQTALVLEDPRKCPLPPCRIQVGDCVLISRNLPGRGPKIAGKEEEYEGCVAAREASHLIITFSHAVPGAEHGVWNVSLMDDKVSVSRAIYAVKMLAHASVEIPAELRSGMDFSQLEKQPGCAPELLPFFLNAGDAKGKPFDFASAAAEKAPEPYYSWIRKGMEGMAMTGEQWSNVNELQKQVILEVPRRRLSIVRGPPGTGKTHTIINLLRFMVFVMPNGARDYRSERAAVMLSMCTHFVSVLQWTEGASKGLGRLFSRPRIRTSGLTTFWRACSRAG